MHLEKGLHGGAAGPAQRAGHPDRECPACHRTAPASRGAARGSRHASDTASGEASDSSWCFGTMRSAAARKPASGRSQRSSSVARASTAGDTEAIGFLPQAVGLSRCQCERQPHGTSLSREAWNRPTPAPPVGHRVAPASLSRRIWSGSRRSAIVCRSSMIAGGTEVGTRPREHGLLMAGSGCGSPRSRDRRGDRLSHVRR